MSAIGRLGRVLRTLAVCRWSGPRGAPRERRPETYGNPQTLEPRAWLCGVADGARVRWACRRPVPGDAVMRGSSPVRSLPFDPARIHISRSRLALERQMQAWPADAGMPPDDVLAPPAHGAPIR